MPFDACGKKNGNGNVVSSELVLNVGVAAGRIMVVGSDVEVLLGGKVPLFVK